MGTTQPRSPTVRGQDTILLIASEVVVVNLNFQTGFDEILSDWLYAEGPVEEEYGAVSGFATDCIVSLRQACVTGDGSE